MGDLRREVSRHSVSRHSAASTAAMPVTTGGGEARSALLMQPAKAWSVFVFGALFPAIAVGAESVFRVLREFFVDVMPTWTHLICGSVALALCACAPWLRVGMLKRPVVGFVIRCAAGFSVGMSAFYFFFLLPILPIALFGTLFFGVGLLGFAPLALFCFSLATSNAIGTVETPHRRLHWAVGVTAAILAVFFLEGSFLRSWSVLNSAQVTTPSVRLAELRRSVGREELASACRGQRYSRSLLASFRENNMTSIGGFGRRITSPRPLYYRVTGEPLENVDLTNHAPFASWSTNSRRPDPELDIHQATSRVGHPVSGLSLSESSLEGTIDNDAAVATLAWTLVFRNDHARLPREARARVKLPTGGVVSGVTAWMHGKPREAAFGSMARVESAYKSVVPERQWRLEDRDPLLVLHDGPDRVRLQCYPVPAGGRTMRIRIEVTAPCHIDASGTATLAPPRFLETNFRSRGSFRHQLAFNASGPIERVRLAANQAKLRSEVVGGIHRLRGELTRRELSSGGVLVRVDRTDAPEVVWCRNPLANKQESASTFVVQELRRVRSEPPRRVAVVVDTSGAMRPYLHSVADAFRDVSPDIRWQLVIAGDNVDVFEPKSEAERSAPGAFLESVIAAQEAVGGRDNAAAVRRARQFAKTPADITLWIHSGQPETLGPDANLLSGEPEAGRGVRMDHESSEGRVVELQVCGGRSIVLEQFDSILSIESLASTGSPQRDLESFMAHWSAGAEVVEVMRRRTETRPDGMATTPTLALLEAKNRVERMARSQQTHRDAARLAVESRLVTRVSGAVVLETDEEYDAHGLKRPPEAVELSRGPALPEPEVVALLVVTALIAAGLLARELRSRYRVAASG